MFRSSCCEVCDRSPWCGVDCGSCHLVEERFVLRDRKSGEVRGELVIEYGEPAEQVGKGRRDDGKDGG